MSSKKMSHLDRILKQARISIRKGRKVVPIPPRRKGPKLKNWTGADITEEKLKHYFGESDNLGWLTGEPSGNLVDIDLDCDAAVTLARIFLPKTDRIHGRESRPASHYWYYSEPLLAHTKFTDRNGECLLELRSSRQQTMVPPSVHPSGERLYWEETGEPGHVDGRVLEAAVGKLAAATLLVRHYPERGHRHEAAMALAGMLLRGGWSEEDIRHFVEAVAEAAEDEQASERVRDVESTIKRLAQGGTATGAPMLASIAGDDVVGRIRKCLNLGSPVDVASAGWANPAALGDELPPVDRFSLDWLPSKLRPLVEDVSDLMQTPMDYAAAAAIVSLAGCVNRRAIVRPKSKDRSWAVVPNLWGVIIAPPGLMKSPVLNSIVAPLNRIEDRWRAGHADGVAQYEKAKLQAELREAAWRSQAKAAIGKGKTIPERPKNSAPPPVEQRLVTTDSTFEKLHEILAGNPAGVLVVRDELSGFLSGLDREGREGERGFFQQAWSGNAPYTIDRIGRGSIHVPAVCVSLLGAIQPARLRWYLADALRGGVNDDGLFQRLQVMVWPDPPAGWNLVDRAPNAAAVKPAERAYINLANLSPDTPVRLSFDSEAQELFYKWWEKLESRVRGDSGLHPAMIGHLSKYRSLMPTVAALFELIDADTDCLSPGDKVLIDVEHAQQAVKFCSYLESHAARVYSCIVSPECRTARELGRHLKKSDLPSPFTTRMVYLKGWSALDSPESVRAALSVLQDAAWVRRVEFPSAVAGGRPSEAWLINPKLRSSK